VEASRAKVEALMAAAGCATRDTPIVRGSPPFDLFNPPGNRFWAPRNTCCRKSLSETFPGPDNLDHTGPAVSVISGGSNPAGALQRGSNPRLDTIELFVSNPVLDQCS
jgi:hypothetical protein